MKTAYIFPGQGAQCREMGKTLYENNPSLRSLFEQANDILGVDITRIMFRGTHDELTRTDVTQPAVFIHSIAVIKTLPSFSPAMTAGHSLGEFSALVASGVLSFEEGLTLVVRRARAMQKACTKEPSLMAAVLGLENHVVEEICDTVEGVVVPANYNCPGQLVISGLKDSVERACEQCKKAGARRALLLPVHGAFHSPLMQSASQELNEAIDATAFHQPECPIYQNVDGLPCTNPEDIKQHLKEQLTAPVRWNSCIQNMVHDGAVSFLECGPGKTLQGLVKKIVPTVPVESSS